MIGLQDRISGTAPESLAAARARSAPVRLANGSGAVSFSGGGFACHADVGSRKICDVVP